MTSSDLKPAYCSPSTSDSGESASDLSGSTDTLHNGGTTLNGYRETVGGGAVVPPADHRRRRTLVLCFDGTGDQFDADNSNVIQLFSMLKKDDRERQMCYYQGGIGTYTRLEDARPLKSTASNVLDQALAWDLDAHVMDGYIFLMQNYKSEDKICMFGFSRGAYTARALAGMIHKVGLLPAGNHQQVPFAYRMYTDTTPLGWQQSDAFKRTFSVDVQIEFIGVWDTVCSVGLYPRTLPFTTSNTLVRTFRHALALDERRTKFQPNLWNRPDEKERELGRDAGGAGGSGARLDKGRSRGRSGVDKENLFAMLKYMEEPPKEEMEMENSGEREPTDVEEVWFAGAHGDVGGGSVKNDTPHTLARIALRWMIRECFKTNTGIMFISSGLRDLGMDSSMLYPVVLLRPPPLSASSISVRNIPKQGSGQGWSVRLPFVSATCASREATSPVLEIGGGEGVVMTEEQHEVLDATSPIYDQLALVPAWWSLELVPVLQRRQREDDTWEVTRRVNLGRGREVPELSLEQGMVRIHRSVKLRMEAGGGSGYIPKADLKEFIRSGRVLWVD